MHPSSEAVSSSDYSLIQDKSFRKFVEIYAKDEAAFFKEYVPSRYSSSFHLLTNAAAASLPPSRDFSSSVYQRPNSCPRPLGISKRLQSRRKRRRRSRAFVKMIFCYLTVYPLGWLRIDAARHPGSKDGGSFHMDYPFVLSSVCVSVYVRGELSGEIQVGR